MTWMFPNKEDVYENSYFPQTLIIFSTQVWNRRERHYLHQIPTTKIIIGCEIVRDVSYIFYSELQECKDCFANDYKIYTMHKVKHLYDYAGSFTLY